jgi:hypothetical protein
MMLPHGSPFHFRLSTALLLIGLAIGVSGPASGAGNGAVGAEHSTQLQLQGTVMCVGCFLNEVQEEQPTQAKTFMQLSQGQDQMVLQVRALSAPPQEPAFAWPPPQLRVLAADRLVDTLSAAAQQRKAVRISGLLRPDQQTLEVTDVALSG